jgi:hypothetical protein
MHCSEATKQLQLYIDNRLHLRQMRALETHLASCASCRQELVLLEEISHALTSTASVKEPANLTANIMQRVALDVQARERQVQAARVRRETVVMTREPYRLFRPSLQELIAVLLLASVTTLGIIMTLPSLRAALPFTSGQDPASHLLRVLVYQLISVNSGTLMWMFWILGTIFGVWITLALAGDEMRKSWLKAMTDRLPVW